MESLERIMALLADGDESAELGLHEHFGTDIRRFLLHLNGTLELPRLAPEDVDGLVWDACALIRGVAGSWRPDGGATPWRYARPRLERLLRDHAGPLTCPLDDSYDLECDWADAEAPIPGADDPPAIVVLDRLADWGDPIVVLLQDALSVVATKPENRELVLLYAVELAYRRRAPSHTVGAMLSRSPESVRQVFCRLRDRLRHLALADHTYRPLLALPMLSPDDDGAGFPPPRRAAGADAAATASTEDGAAA